jgi:FHS family L-fucose permease-like MFS transporter
VLKRTGMKKGMALGLFVMAIGAVLFGSSSRCACITRRAHRPVRDRRRPVAAADRVNPYISILGPIDSAAQRIAFMGICNKVAGAVAPFVFGALVLSDITLR